MKKNIDIQPLVDVVAKLRAPDGCPWDKVQTHESLRRYFIEETYEVVDAIDNKDMHNLREELGDVLLQVVFHSSLAEESGSFSLQDVINDVTEKMIHRHPNVFPQDNPEKEGKIYTWDELKAQEKGNIRKNVLDGISKGLPALVAAQKLQEKAGKVGFDWDELEPVWAKVSEEIGEFKEAVAKKDRENMEKEAGDVLFSLINLFRWYKISGENALNRTNTKFRQRFSHVEACVNQSDRSWEDFSLAELLVVKFKLSASVLSKFVNVLLVKAATLKAVNLSQSKLPNLLHSKLVKV